MLCASRFIADLSTEGAVCVLVVCCCISCYHSGSSVLACSAVAVLFHCVQGLKNHTFGGRQRMEKLWGVRGAWPPGNFFEF